jgi:tetratricopeptide (TPR) repeat protein
MERRRVLLLSLILVTLTVALYWPTTRFDFVVVDDDRYVTDNPHVSQGLTLANLPWAFTSVVAANWHPVTLISHMLDCSLYGLFAGGHHLTSLLLHATNTLLLFLLLRRWTKSEWRSLAVAALFGWHPQHVESVAWIAERKDVLSTLFFLLTLLAYTRYVTTPTRARYGLALVLFALGLMAKPMLVTLPCVLLLLDYWPLRRVRSPSDGATRWLDLRTNLKLLTEKIPFFALAFAAGLAAIIAQHAGGAVKSLEEVPFSLRGFNSFAAYTRYLVDTFCPVNLCVYYPMPQEPPFLAGTGSALVLAGVTVVVFRWRTTWPWLIVGWLWFLITLVPVIGWIQVGNQALADRYTYIPHIGLFMALVWSGHHGLEQRTANRTWGFGIAFVSLLACLTMTQRQLTYWHDSLALYQHAVAVTKNNAHAQQNLGVALANAGRPAEAMVSYRESLRLQPRNVQVHYNLGGLLAAAGELEAAKFHFSEAIRDGSKSELVHNNFGTVLARLGEFDSASAHFKHAIKINPNYPKPYLNYASVLQKTGRAGAAVTNYSKALQLDPAWPEALDQLAFLLATCPDPAWRNPAAAVKLAEQAAQLTQNSFPNYADTLALTYAADGKYSNAVTTAELAKKQALEQGLPALAQRLDLDLTAYRKQQNPPRDWRQQ